MGYGTDILREHMFYQFINRNVSFHRLCILSLRHLTDKHIRPRLCPSSPTPPAPFCVHLGARDALGVGLKGTTWRYSFYQKAGLGFCGDQR
jgi:hypothetical protein